MVIGITSFKYEAELAGIGVRTLFAITRDSIFVGEFPPVFPGTTTTLARLFGRSQRHSASNSGNFRANSAQFVTDSRGHRYRPLSRLSRPAAPPFAPPLPTRRRPPRAARLPGRTTSRAPLGGRSGPGGEAVEGREYTYTERATTEKINKRHHLPGAPITIVLRAVRVYKSGSSREGLFRALPAHSPGPGVPVSAGICKGVRNSWRCGMAAGCRDRVHMATRRRIWPLLGQFSASWPFAAISLVSLGTARWPCVSWCRNGTATAVACRGCCGRAGFLRSPQVVGRRPNGDLYWAGVRASLRASVHTAP